MRILFDHCTPARLRHYLAHTVVTAYEQGWSTLRNGDLLGSAQQHDFDLFLSADSDFKIYEQKIRDARIAMIILSKNNWPKVQMTLLSKLAKEPDEHG